MLDQLNNRHPLVLIVDDNAAIRDMVSWALELDGFEPAEAAEGAEALAWMDNATREGRPPAVILLDIAMPGMGGETFLEQLRSRWEPAYPSPSIIVITAGAGVPNVTRLGITNVIIKPFHVRDLLDVVRKLTVG